MGTLYELKSEYIQLRDMAGDPDIGPEALRDTMEAINGELEDKADGYAKVIRELEAEEAGLDAEIKRLQARKSAVSGNKGRIKDALESAMRETGKLKFKTALFSFGIQKNPPSVAILSENIPLDYLVVPEPQPDKKRILAELKAGATFDWAELRQTEALRIR
ncbi:siphovirus Gp157 family protein [Stomatobaculum longum]